MPRTKSSAQLELTPIYFRQLTLHLRRGGAPNLSSISSPSCDHTFTTNQVPFLWPRFFLNCDMGDQSRSAHFQALFDSALQSYEKNTGVSLAEHPLAAQLQDCHSVESVTTLLQHQAKDFSDFRGKNKAMKLIESTVSILSTLSDNTAIGGSIVLVRQNALMGVPRLTNFCRHSHPQVQYKLGSPSYSLYVPFVAPTCISL